MNTPTQNINIEELVSLLKSRTEQAYRMLYDNYSGALYGVIMKVMKDRESEAEDILQNTFLKIWRNIDQYDPSKSSLFTWMLTIARNSAIDHLRVHAKVIKIQLEDSNVTDSKFVSQSSSDFIGVQDKINLLSPPQQQLIDVLYFKGYTHQEASEELNIPLGTVKTSIRSALIKLRELLKE